MLMSLLLIICDRFEIDKVTITCFEQIMKSSHEAIQNDYYP